MCKIEVYATVYGYSEWIWKHYMVYISLTSCIMNPPSYPQTCKTGVSTSTKPKESIVLRISDTTYINWIDQKNNTDSS